MQPVNKATRFLLADVGVSAAQVLGPDTKRTRVVVFPHNTARLFVAFNQDPSSLGSAIIQINGHPLIMDREDYGDTICGPLFVLASAAGAQIGLIEVKAG